MLIHRYYWEDSHHNYLLHIQDLTLKITIFINVTLMYFANMLCDMLTNH